VSADGSDLVVWPEASARDFGAPGSDLSSYAETTDGPFAQALRAAAGESTAIAGMFEQGADPARPFNTLLVTGAVSASYRKIHLYDSFGHRESDVLSGGDIAPVVVDVAGWKVGLMTCYDLRFPELARLLVDAGAEVIVVPAAWVAGDRKVAHWRTLLAARAIENLAFVVGVAQPGPRYCGHSQVVSPLGDVLAEAGWDTDEVLDVTLDRGVFDEARRLNPSLDNRRIGL
jgi:predicted amidohydrolase